MDRHGRRRMDEGPHAVDCVMAGRAFDVGILRAARDLTHLGVGQRRRQAPAEDAGTPFAKDRRLFLELVVFAGAGKAVGRMDEFVMGGVEAVLHRALVVVVELPFLKRRAPARLPVLGNVHDRRTLFFRQVAEEREDEAVLLDRRIGIYLRPRRDPGVLAHGGNAHALAVAVVLPAVIGALDIVALDLAVRETAAAMNAHVAHDVGHAVRIAVEHEVDAQHAHLARLLLEVVGFQGRVPEIDEHRSVLYRFLMACSTIASTHFA